MKYVSELKNGDIIRYVETEKLFTATYICPHTKRVDYHILLDENEMPIGMLADTLQNYLNQNIITYDDAKKFIAESAKKRAQKIIDEHNANTIPLKVVEDFIYEVGEDYNLWDEDTQGAYPIKRVLTAMENFLKFD